MASRDNRQQGIIAAWSAHKNIANLVNFDRQPSGFTPANDQIPALTIKVGQR
jgi:hypothetical protein